MVKQVKQYVGGLLLLLLVQMTPLVIQPVVAETLPTQLAKAKKRLSQSAGATLLPFFDQTNNPVSVFFPKNQKVDITPVPPQLNAFDQKVLQTCGPFGSSVSTIALRRLFSESPNVVQTIKQAIGGEIFPGRRTDQQFSDDLLTIWSTRRGFEHIFCGQINSAQKIGGLHFRGRYLQLQTGGIGGRLPNNATAEEVVEGKIYTLGVVILKNGRVIARDTKKGYAYGVNAQAILTNATRAFKQFKTSRKQACLYTVQPDPRQPPFKEVFVKTDRAIVTFYPDATPNQKDPSCGG